MNDSSILDPRLSQREGPRGFGKAESLLPRMRKGNGSPFQDGEQHSGFYHLPHARAWRGKAVGLLPVLSALPQVVKGLWKPVSCPDFSFFFLSTESDSCEKQSVRLRAGWSSLRPGLCQKCRAPRAGEGSGSETAARKEGKSGAKIQNVCPKTLLTWRLPGTLLPSL